MTVSVEGLDGLAALGVLILSVVVMPFVAAARRIAVKARRVAVVALWLMGNAIFDMYAKDLNLAPTQGPAEVQVARVLGMVAAFGLTSLFVLTAWRLIR